MPIDYFDTELIDLLRQDANVSSTVLAERLNVNSSTVRRRVKNLIDDGVIRIVALPNLEKMGLPVTAFISLEVSHERVKAVLQELSRNPHAAWVGATSGLFNVRTKVNQQPFAIQDISKINGILRIETSICLQVEKRNSVELSSIPALVSV